mmetsp:Transcript_34916/g.67928  ORF Transcript_34916/g.67928 Transcript_34916/m.67928 type:complete len:355 (-) Transcript_34916:215-1279(-)
MPTVHSVLWFSAGTGALSWVCFKLYDLEATSLKRTPSIPIEDLPNAINQDGTPCEVAIEGVVACDTPIQTQYREGSQANCVYYTLTEIAHYARLGLFGWSEEEKPQTSSHSVPFRLVPPGGESKGVSMPALIADEGDSQGISGLLTILNDVTVRKKFTFEDFVEQMRGSRRMQRSSQYVESGLEVGTPLTVVGPVVKRKNDIKMVSQPHIVSKKSCYELVREAEERAQVWEYVFYGFSGLAIACVAYMGYQYVMDYYSRRVQRQRINAFRERKHRRDQDRKYAVHKSKGLDKTSDSKGGDEHQKLCVVCQERTANAVLMDCRHLYTCTECTSKLRPHNCPICRRPIRKVIRVYN